MMTWDEYYLAMARVAASRSSCSRRHVGCVIVVDGGVASTGYNGTPRGWTNCNQGGCARCASDAPPGTGYDHCLCVHAEQNAVALAARRGSRLDGGVAYVTLRPCFSCLKDLLQAGIREVVYSGDFVYDARLEEIYLTLIHDSGILFRREEQTK